LSDENEAVNDILQVEEIAIEITSKVPCKKRTSAIQSLEGFQTWGYITLCDNKQMHAQPHSFKVHNLNTSEHRSTKVLLVGTLQQELQVTSRQILGGLSKSLATLILSLRFVPDSPACIKH